ncbi:MULE domain-containing protein [Aphis craccivora]|uniref:MULE domain-containing protein n=1 Tax=Aphis craccivora TaxID=307492 RepID=A0A6G0WGK9_APHCR|nr:MULE domain-containing protein [Aphis craccivora]
MKDGLHTIVKYTKQFPEMNENEMVMNRFLMDYITIIVFLQIGFGASVFGQDQKLLRLVPCNVAHSNWMPPQYLGLYRGSS